MTKLDELKAKVETAAKGTWRVGETQTANVIFADRGAIGQFGQMPQSPFARANADLAATAVNLARRLTSEEGVMTMAKGMFEATSSERWEAQSPSTKGDYTHDVLAALNALLSDSQP